jgi:hypothetical protein
MNCKIFLCITLLTSALMTAVLGCQSESTVATTQAADKASSTTQPTFSTTATSPLKPTQPNAQIPSGNVTPPSDNFTAERPGAMKIDLATVAAKLGVTNQQLSDALGNIQQGILDFASIAEKLGTTEQVLLEALGITSSNGTMPSNPSGNQPPASFNGTMPGAPSGQQPPGTTPDNITK